MRKRGGRQKSRDSCQLLLRMRRYLRDLNAHTGAAFPVFQQRQEQLEPLSEAQRRVNRPFALFASATLDARPRRSLPTHLWIRQASCQRCASCTLSAPTLARSPQSPNHCATR